MAIETTSTEPFRGNGRRNASLDTMWNYEIEVALEAIAWETAWPHAAQTARDAASAVLVYLAKERQQSVELSIVLGDDALVQRLNRTYRDKDAATNVLAFPLNDANVKAVVMADEGSKQATLLGDVVVAYETVVREAAEQHKERDAHLAHLVAHGVLHLLDFDHQTEPESEEMMAAERAVLSRLGFDDPYAVSDAPQQS